MNIIKRGIRPEDYYWEGHCMSCGTVMECKKRELKDISFGGQRGEEEFGKHECVICGHSVNFYPTNRIVTSLPDERTHWHD